MENKIEFKPFDKVLVRDNETHIWQIDLFETYKMGGSRHCYKCLGTSWAQCIPFEGNEHLLGTTDSPQREEEQEGERQDGVSNNYGYPVEYFKRNDRVLCRDGAECVWVVDSFIAENEGNYPFRCKHYNWKFCIPYIGNEHLQGTTETPEQYKSSKNTLFGIELKAGYVLEFGERQVGVIFPMKKNGFSGKTEFAIMYLYRGWEMLDDAVLSKVNVVRGFTGGGSLLSGDILWKRPEKQTFTKAEIAEKLGIGEQDFEIIEKENE